MVKLQPLEYFKLKSELLVFEMKQMELLTEFNSIQEQKNKLASENKLSIGKKYNFNDEKFEIYEV